MAKQASLKIGIVCEGQFDGAEDRVFPKLLRLLCPHASCDVVPSGNRPNVLKEAPKIAKRLLASGCHKVFVLWDTHPEWPDAGGTTDCKEHCKTLNANLQAHGMPASHITAIAIRHMLEAWLIADGDAINETMERKPHPLRVRAGHHRDPDSVKKPKTLLRKLFSENHVNYNESVNAGHIAANLKRVDRLLKSQSFKQFAKKVAAVCKSVK